MLKETHDTKWDGHPGKERTLVLLAQSFHWPKMKEDMQAYVKTCHVCQVDKTKQEEGSGFAAAPAHSGKTMAIVTRPISGLRVQHLGTH